MNAAFSLPQRVRITVKGVVQGVGFRPFVYGLATRLGLTGFVGNDSAGVFIEVEGPTSAIDAFTQALSVEAPPLAHIEAVTAEAMDPTGESAFVIVASAAQPSAATLISPDLCTCDDCLRELFDPADRRYRYPFINCTNCGPRFTITQDIPYDRPLTTMAPFVMCPDCQREYDDPLDRRFHAQPNACAACGPRVTWNELRVPNDELRVANDELRGAGSEDRVTQYAVRSTADAAIVAAQRALADGRIVAVKGLGGVHLACDATSDDAVAQLRERKGRVDKPFAVMAADLAAVTRIARVNDAEHRLLTSRQRPIVLLRKRTDSPLSQLVAPGTNTVGVMLPYTPLHHLLMRSGERGARNDPSRVRDDQADAGNIPRSPLPAPRCLVLTSGNYSNEPIVKENEEALEKLGELADGFLLHDRAIHVHCDDAVVRVFDGRELPVRRSRGYAPFPVRLPFAAQPILAVGGELKATFCLTRERHAFMSQHIGDMENLETLRAFEHAVAHMQTLFRIDPEIVACDLHPGYLSTRWAHEQAGGRPVIPVQHHHAHIAAVMAEHGLDGAEPVIGFAFDGTGFGTDGAIWGGEALIADYHGFTRAAHLAYVPLPGGDAAIQRPYRTALAHLHAAGVPWDPALPAVAAAPELERRAVLHQIATGLNAVPTSSMGRLFDAVASLAGVRQRVTYEGQAAMELEAKAEAEAEAEAKAEAEEEGYGFEVVEGGSGGEAVTFGAGPLMQAVAADVLAGVPAATIAWRFHLALADLCLRLSLRLRTLHGLNSVALSGGVFQNVTLLRLTVERLERAGFRVLHHRLVPPNDGGLALGQAAVAQHRSRDRTRM